MKRTFRYRFHPTDAQAAALARTFGCVRKVYNLALATLAYLNDVASVPLQQALRHLQAAFTNFFAKRARYPTFKSRKKSRRSAEYTTSAFRWRDDRLTLAKMAEPFAYKADWYGRELITVDRWYPSSKVCPACGMLAEQMPLNARSWTCRCGTTHDRDAKAARNILAAGLAVPACGAGIRPQRESSRTGLPAVKQETPGATQGIPSRQEGEDVSCRTLAPYVVPVSRARANG